MTTFSLAPGAVVRVAQWPLDDIEALASPSLATAAENLDPDDLAAVTKYRSEYEAGLESARSLLWSTTAAQPLFRAALAMSSPSLHAGLGTGEPPASRTKSVRHLETSLYRYLARAACRTEPYGMWTSVGIATFGETEHTRIEDSPPRVHLAPDLAPFGEILRALAKQNPYLDRGPYLLNPTLQRLQDGSWMFAKREQDTGALSWVAVPTSIAGRLYDALSGHVGSRTEQRLRLQEDSDDPLVDSLLEVAFDAGLLLGGLDLPARFPDPWTALTKAQESLDHAHAYVWEDSCRAAKLICDRLTRALTRIRPDHLPEELGDAVVRANDELRMEVFRLAAALGCSLDTEPRSWIRCDLTAGWRIELGREDRARIERLLRGWSELEQHYDTVGRRAVTTGAMLGDCPGGRVMAAPGAQRYLPGPPASHTTEISLGPPMGALIIRPGQAGLHTPWLRGMSTVPTATHARHAYHLADQGDPLLEWFRRQYHLLRELGVEVVDLGYANGASPNLTARPAYVEAMVAPWAAESTMVLSGAALLTPGPRPGSLLVEDSGRRMSVHAFTATTAHPSDVVLRRLIATSFDDRLRESKSGSNAERLGCCPNSGAVLVPPRTALSAEETESLSTGSDRAERFRRWVRLARKYSWPSLVRVTVDDRSSLVVPITSPLALEATLEGLQSTASILVEDVVERGFVSSSGGRHVVEFVVPVRRRQHLWHAEAQHRALG